MKTESVIRTRGSSGVPGCVLSLVVYYHCCWHFIRKLFSNIYVDNCGRLFCAVDLCTRCAGGSRKSLATVCFSQALDSVSLKQGRHCEFTFGHGWLSVV